MDYFNYSIDDHADRVVFAEHLGHVVKQWFRRNRRKKMEMGK